MSEETYGVVVIGAGAIGENVADRAGRTGLSVVLVESELVGGECSYWACMPSKALLRPGAALAAARAVPGAAEAVTGPLDRDAVLARRDSFASHWDDQGQVEWVDGAGIALVRGHARIEGPKQVRVTPDDGPPVLLTAEHAVVVATGSEATVPPIDGLAEVSPWTSREATSADDVPDRLAIIGGGVVGVEMATAYSDLGSQVTMLVRGDRLLPGTEPFAGEAVADSLRRLGVDLRLGVEATRVRRDGAGVHLELTEGGPLQVEEVLVATGRRPRTGELGLDRLGLPTDAPLRVDATGAVVGGPDWLFAAGDVTGRTATTHQGKYDARVVGDVVAHRFGSEDALGPEAVATADPWSRFRMSADDAAQPQVVFSRPEVSMVGLTEQAATDAGIPLRVLHVPFSAVAGAAVAADDYAGAAQLVVDTARDVVVGATFVGQDAAELLHAATIAVVGEVPLSRLWHAVPAYPTVSEVWLRLLESANL